MGVWLIDIEHSYFSFLELKWLKIIGIIIFIVSIPILYALPYILGSYNYDLLIYTILIISIPIPIGVYAWMKRQKCIPIEAERWGNIRRSTSLKKNHTWNSLGSYRGSSLLISQDQTAYRKSNVIQPKITFALLIFEVTLLVTMIFRQVSIFFHFKLDLLSKIELSVIIVSSQQWTSLTIILMFGNHIFNILFDKAYSYDCLYTPYHQKVISRISVAIGWIYFWLTLYDLILVSIPGYIFNSTASIIIFWTIFPIILLFGILYFALLAYNRKTSEDNL